MNGIKIKGGTKELAAERKLVREILIPAIKELNSQSAGYTLKRVGESYQGANEETFHRDGYRADYTIIASGPKDRIQQSMNISVQTQGSNYQVPELDRVLVRVHGRADCRLENPRERSFHRTSKGIDITFARNRQRQHQINAVVREINEARPLFDEAVEYVEKCVKGWDKFARQVERLRTGLNVARRHIWRPGFDQDQIMLDIPETARRKTKATVKLSGGSGAFYGGAVELTVDHLTESKLAEIVRIIRK